MYQAMSGREERPEDGADRVCEQHEVREAAVAAQGTEVEMRNV